MTYTSVLFFLLICLVFASSCTNEDEEPLSGNSIYLNLPENSPKGTIVTNLSDHGIDGRNFTVSRNRNENGVFMGELEIYPPSFSIDTDLNMVVEDPWLLDSETFSDISVAITGESVGGEEVRAEVFIKIVDQNDVSLDFELVNFIGIDLPTLIWHEVVVFRDSLWIIGGNSGGATNNNEVWKSGNGQNWIKTENNGDRFAPPSSLEVLVFKEKLWVFSRKSNEVWYSENGEDWSMHPVDFNIQPGTGSVFNGSLWLLGGADDRNNVSSIWKSDNGFDWEQVSPVGGHFSPRDYHSASVFHGKLFVIGGQALTDNNDIWMTEDGLIWEQVEVIGRWFSRIAAHQATVYDNKLWILGGGDEFDNGYSANPRNELFAFNFEAWSSADGISWNRETTGGRDFSLIFGHQMVTFKDRIWVIGGRTPELEIWRSID